MRKTIRELHLDLVVELMMEYWFTYFVYDFYYYYRLIPAPKGTGLVAAPTPKKVLQLAGVTDCYTTSRGSTRTLGNFVKATFAAIGNTYGFLTPGKILFFIVFG